RFPARKASSGQEVFICRTAAIALSPRPNRTEDDMATNQGKYRNRLPQLSDRLFLTDGGMETTLVFHDKIDLPCFAAFTLMKTDEGVAYTRRYYERYIAMARASGLGFVLESPTWRANPDWAEKLGYS